MDNLWEGDAATLHPRRQARRGKGVHFTLLHLRKQVHIGQLKRLDLAAEEKMLQPSREGSFPVSVKHLFTSSVRFRSGRHPGNQSSPGAPNTCLQNLPFGVIALSTYYGGGGWGGAGGIWSGAGEWVLQSKSTHLKRQRLSTMDQGHHMDG